MLTYNKIQAALDKMREPVSVNSNRILLPSFCEAYVELHPEIITYLVGKDCKIEYYSLLVTGEEENKIIASIKEQALAKRQLDYSSIQPICPYWIRETETEHVLMSDYHDEALASISRDPTYGYWAVTGQVEGEFPSLSEAKTFVEEQLYKP